MPYKHKKEEIHSALTYADYRAHIRHSFQSDASDETTRKLNLYAEQNSTLMDLYDKSYTVSDGLKKAVESAPSMTWLVIAEGWCGDAAFNVPLLAAVEREFPHKVKLRIFLRDTNHELMDAYLTEGVRSIPKLVVLNGQMNELGTWGPRPGKLQGLMKGWKGEGLTLKELIPKVHRWYDVDRTSSIQDELIALLQSCC